VATVTLTSRQIGGGFIIALGGLALLSGLCLNPVVGKLVRGPSIVNSADVYASYFWCSMIVGLILIAIGTRVIRGRSRADDIALLALVVAGVVLCDRYLLTRFGLPGWIHDSDIGYRNRPNVVRTFDVRGSSEYVAINRWGFRGPDFPLQKPKGEFRVLLIGDSVTMGYSVSDSGSFGAHLEELLDANDRRFASHRVINTGVLGYATFHEKITLERALKFSPDIIFVGFCMNDVTEPFVVDKEFGGTGLDYAPSTNFARHRVTQSSNAIVGWFANETGFGQLEHALIARGKSLEAEKRLEIYDVRKMAAESRSTAKMQEAWRIVLKQMAELYGIAQQHRVPVVLVIFPFTFQLADPSLRAPQEILAQHAREHAVPVIDTTDDFAKVVFDDPELVEYGRFIEVGCGGEV
jgi:lysophospholipase L1-like esterase